MIRARIWLGASAMLALGVAGLWYQMKTAAPSAKPVAASAIPVTVTYARSQDVPVLLDGLGTVTPFNRVMVHVRVDGELQAVNFTEGQNVKQGEVLAQIDPRPFQAQLDQARASKAHDEAQLANAKLNLTRDTTLVAKDFATRQTVDTEKALVAQLEATVSGDQAAIENAQTQLGYTTIVSPLNGRTGMRLIDRGNIVHASDPQGLVLISQVRPISVLFSLPQDHLQNITSAMKREPLKVFAYSRDDKTKVAQGTLVLVDNQIDTSTGMVRLKAVFPNDDDALWPGEFLHAHLQLEIRKGSVTVPAEVLQRGPHDLYVYVVGPNSRVQQRRVTVGPVEDGIAVIDSGLRIGEEVVTDGQFKLKPGATVEVTTLLDLAAPAAAERTAQRERRAPP
jgi:membrane fusion protein, multidrug efflux system